MERNPAKKAAKASAPHSPTPINRVDTPQSKHPLNRVRTRPPLGDRDKRILALCEERRRELRISKSEAGRRAGVDRSDAVKALSLKSATPRTILAFARLFKIADAKPLARGTRIEALLIEIRADLDRAAELMGELAALAAGNDPPLGG